MAESKTQNLDRLILPVAGHLRWLAALSVAGNLVWPLQAALVAAAIGGAVTGAATVPALMAAAYVMLGLCRAWLGMQADHLAHGVAENVISGLRSAIVTEEARASRVRDGFGPGAVAALAAEKLEALTPWLVRYGPARARVMAVPLIILALAFWFSWAAGLILLISGPLIPVFMALVGLAAKEASARQMAEIGSLNDLLVDRLGALLDIRLLGASRDVEEGFAAQAGDLRARTMAVLRLAFLSSTVLELFAAIGVAMMAVFVGFSLLGEIRFGTWGAPLSPEAGIFLLLLAPEFYQPLRDLAAAWHDKAAAEAVADELAEWQARRGAPLPGGGTRVKPLNGPASLSLQGCVTTTGLRLPDIEVGAGEAVALVGPSGAGKTSALRLMAGLELPAQGRVLVAGQDLTPETADAWRARLGWMPQRARFLNASLWGNLSLGRDGDMDAALKAAAAETVVANLPRGLATVLGETGGGMSGGEARRMTLARALFAAPDVILADEPTADLDSATAAVVADSLLDARRHGVTLVVATHDMKLAVQMDRVIRIGGEA